MRGHWDRARVAAVAVGGAAGAAVRWSLVTSIDTGRFPWAVFLLNVAGSILLGVLLAEETRRPSRRVLLHDAGAIGFCGGVTTFSTFSIEVVELIRDGFALMGAAYAAGSVLAAIAGVAAGAAALHRVRALTIPVEGEP